MKHFALTVLLLILSVTLHAQSPITRRYPVMNMTEANTVHPIPKGVGTPGKPVPCTGTPHIPILLVQFSDLYFSVESTPDSVHEDYYKFCNGSGIPGQVYRVPYAYGSVHDYFVEMSDSTYSPIFDVFGPITLDKSYAYYGQNSGSRKDININQFWSEALSQAISDYEFNTDLFDNNNDGIMDFVFAVYAGEGENISNADPNTIWPKESSSVFNVTVNGTTYKFGGYGCTNEIFNNKHDGVGTFCHEFGHGLGLPDLYDSQHVADGMDYWDVMDSGDYILGGSCPVGFSAYERDFMGWRRLVELSPDTALTLTLDPLELGGVGYKIVNKKNPNEYFILENRQNHSFDTFLGCPSSTVYKNWGTCHGLMVTHVDYLASVWATTPSTVNSNKNHQRLTLIPADGTTGKYLDVATLADLEEWTMSAQGDLYPGITNKTELYSYATYDGNNTLSGEMGCTITNIREIPDPERGTNIIMLDINGGTPTAITNIDATKQNDKDVYYDLSGRKVSQPQRGFYIHNGRKTFYSK